VVSDHPDKKQDFFCIYMKNEKISKVIVSYLKHCTFLSINENFLAALFFFFSINSKQIQKFDFWGEKFAKNVYQMISL